MPAIFLLPFLALFFVCAACAPAFWKLVARSSPPWQVVQPNVSIGCGEPEPG